MFLVVAVGRTGPADAGQAAEPADGSGARHA